MFELMLDDVKKAKDDKPRKVKFYLFKSEYDDMFLLKAKIEGSSSKDAVILTVKFDGDDLKLNISTDINSPNKEIVMKHRAEKSYCVEHWALVENEDAEEEDEYGQKEREKFVRMVKSMMDR